MTRKIRKKDSDLVNPTEIELPKQLRLFRMLLLPPNDQEDQSNILMFWDSIPKYSISRHQQAKMRSESGQLPILRHHFRFDGQEYEMELTPAYLSSQKNETGIAYYPGYTEELIEDVLRKFLLDDTCLFQRS